MFDRERQNYDMIYNNNPQPNEEFEKYEEHQGKQVNHGFAKELIAGIAGAEVDKLAETHGMDWIDKEKAKHQAKNDAQQMYDQSYGRIPEGDRYHNQPNQFYQGPPQQGGYNNQYYQGPPQGW